MSKRYAYVKHTRLGNVATSRRLISSSDALLKTTEGTVVTAQVVKKHLTINQGAVMHSSINLNDQGGSDSSGATLEN